MKFQKQTYFRSKAHLKNVASLPCQVCGIDFQVQAAHSNWTNWGGKGRGIKASDEYTAAICHHCHRELDQGSKLSKEERQKMWLEAHNKTVALLQARGLWPEDVPLPNFQDL